MGMEKSHLHFSIVYINIENKWEPPSAVIFTIYKLRYLTNLQFLFLFAQLSLFEIFWIRKRFNYQSILVYGINEWSLRVPGMVREFMKRLFKSTFADSVLGVFSLANSNSLNGVCIRRLYGFWRLAFSARRLTVSPSRTLKVRGCYESVLQALFQSQFYDYIGSEVFFYFCIGGCTIGWLFGEG